ncbi:MAG: ubiquinol-cytochrome C chaperone [Hyphomicrobiales bacterium]|nr:ubiquinol-cytochrome C chaperone [Hyphomicrobiales bacterium]
MISIPFFRPRPDPIAALYGDIVAAARMPRVYAEFGVADDFEGRFEYLALVATLALRRLRSLPPPAGEIAQQLVDRVFDGLDDALRRIGVSDLAVGKKVKKLAQGFYGRAGAYSAALDSGAEADMRTALARNLFGGRLTPEAVPPALLAELAAMTVRLDAAPLDALLAGGVLAAPASRSGGTP